MAAVGFREHTGWAIAVAIGDDVTLVDRWRIELCDPALPRQLYHAAQALAPADAEVVVAEVKASAAEWAGAAIAEVRAAVPGLGAVGVAHGRRVDATVAEIVANHALMHTAEGALYREVVAEAAAAAGLAIARPPLKEVVAAAGQDWLVAMGKAAGPPWRKDHREAAALAWLALTVT